MATREDAVRRLRGPYADEEQKARAALLKLIEADYPDLAAERKRRQEEQWADGRRRLKVELGD